VARARGRTDAFEYQDLGVPAVRETFGSALDAAQMALTLLGRGADEARHTIEVFRKHDEAMLRRAAPHRHDGKRLLAINDQGRADLDRLLSSEATGTPPERQP
jgi:glutathione-regulated potassium-efflux system ancillary protein KefC